MNHIIFKDIDIYFINLLFDHNEINLLKNISELNKKYNQIIKEKLKDFYAFWNYISSIKYKFNIFAESCIFGNLNVVKFYKNKINDEKLDKYFYLSCEYGHLDIAKWLYTLNGKIKIHYGNEGPFRLSCENGYLHIAQWIYSLDGEIYIHMYDDYAFRWSCKNGHLNIAQWLYSLDNKIDIHIGADWAFIKSCKYGHLSVVQWLYSLDGEINIHANNDYAFKRSPQHILDWLLSL